MHAEFLFREHMLDTHAIMSQCVHMYVEDHTTYMAIYSSQTMGYNTVGTLTEVHREIGLS